MNTGAIAGVVVGAVIVLALLILVGMLARRRQLQRHREQARQQRQEAEVHAARAQRREAEVAERQARAAREQATAREQAAQARADRRAAAQQQATASRLDPGHPGHTDGDRAGARSDVGITREATDEHGETDRPRGLGRLTPFGRRKTTVPAADAGSARQPGHASAPKHAAVTARHGEGDGQP